jgi:hypothetical protein
MVSGAILISKKDNKTTTILKLMYENFTHKKTATRYPLAQGSGKNSSRTRVPRLKKHRIPDPEHCSVITV